MAEIHEDDHSVDTTGEFQEPAGGWVEGPQLFDTELLVTSLCRFSGEPVGHGEICPAWLEHRHPDEPCVAYYVQAAAFREGRIDLSGFGNTLPEEVRLPSAGGEPTGGSHG